MFDLDTTEELAPTLSDSVCYDATDVLDALASFSLQVPDCLPAFTNYYQDVQGGFDSFTVLTRIDGVKWSDLTDTERNEWTLSWYKSGSTDPWFTGTPPPFNQLEWDCDGGFELTLRMTHITGAQFERTEPAWVFNHLQDYPSCDEGISFFDAGSVIFVPDVEPYHYQVNRATADFYPDQQINTADLLEVVGNWCPPVQQ